MLESRSFTMYFLVGLLFLAATVNTTTIAELSFKLNVPTHVDNLSRTTEPVLVNDLKEKAQNEIVNAEPAAPSAAESSDNNSEQTSPSILISNKLNDMKLSKGQPIVSLAKLNNTYSSGSLSSLLLAALAPLRVEGKDGQLVPVQPPNFPVPFASVLNQRENVQAKSENKEIQSIKDLHTTIISGANESPAQQGTTAIEAEIDAVVAKTTGQLISGSSAVSNQQQSTNSDDSLVDFVSTKVHNLNVAAVQSVENSNNTMVPPTVPIAIATEPSLLNISTILNVPLRELVGAELGSPGGKASGVSSQIWLLYGSLVFILFKEIF